MVTFHKGKQKQKYVCDTNLLNLLITARYVFIEVLPMQSICSLKVRSYYAAIVLLCRYINHFLSHVTAASPHFKLKLI